MAQAMLSNPSWASAGQDSNDANSLIALSPLAVVSSFDNTRAVIEGWVNIRVVTAAGGLRSLLGQRSVGFDFLPFGLDFRL